MNEYRVLAPTAILGYGFPEASFAEGMKRKPHAIAVDAGSTDPGPYYLGAGKSFTDRAGVKRDMVYMIKAGIAANIPVIIGSAGGSGANSHLEWNVEIVQEIAREQSLSFKLGIIKAQIDKAAVLKHHTDGSLKKMHSSPLPSPAQIQASSNIVAQMGIEPFIKALDMGAQVIVAGRAYDPAVFACLAVKNGFDEGLAMHMGKILECATIAAVPGSGSDCMLGTLTHDSFTVEPLSNARKCTTLSVAAHTLYEKSDPTKLPGPGGTLDLTQCVFEQASENSVRVKNTKFIPDNEYHIKLEGAALKGYRTVSIAAAADPIFIQNIETITAAVKERVQSNFANLKDYFLDFKIYGKNGVMGMFKGHSSPHTCHPTPQTAASLPPEGCHGIPTSHEIAIVIEAVAKSQETANTICSFARSSLLHFGYEGRKSTAGNLAFPFSPSDFEAGEVYEFSVYCLMPSPDPCQYFPVSVIEA
ncbi:MAG: DUF1446 domain-containing protein [Defluviitaleaceae bacterium]|nr:DUF1446 domain-containing protein [Defluviitaleaceae bacterium]